MSSEHLRTDWLALSAEEQSRLLTDIRGYLTQRLDMPVGCFPLSSMNVCAALRRGSSVVLHVITDLVERREVQSGSDGDDHTIWEVEAVFTLSLALVSAECRLVYDRFIIEYDLDGYKPEEVLARETAKIVSRLLERYPSPS